MSHRPYSYAALALLTGAVLGYYGGRQMQERLTVEKNIVTQGKETVVTKDRIVTITKVVRPDGTVEESTRTEDFSTEVEKVVESRVSERMSQVTAASTHYSLGVRYGSSYSELIRNISSPTPGGVEVTAGMRILGPIWIDAGASYERVTLGVRYEF